MFRPASYFKPSQLIVVIGNALVPLGVLAPSPVGSASLQDLFSTPKDKAYNQSSLSFLDIKHAMRTWGEEPLVSDLYTVSLTQIDGVRCVCWKTGKNEFYREERLAENRAGRALLTASVAASKRTRVSQWYPAAVMEARREDELPASAEPLNPTEELSSPLRLPPMKSMTESHPPPK